MHRPVLARLLTLVLVPVAGLASQGAELPPPGAPSGKPVVVEAPTAQQDPEPTPPGSPADQALWREAGEVSNRIYLRRIEANKLQWELRRGSLDERLAAAAKGATPDDARRLEASRARLIAAWTKNYEILVSQWPVDPTRGCSYARVLLASSMQANDGPRTAQARDDARKCVEVANAAVGRLERSTGELEAAIDEAEREIASHPTPPAPPARE